MDGNPVRTRIADWRNDPILQCDIKLQVLVNKVESLQDEIDKREILALERMFDGKRNEQGIRQA